MIIWHFWIIIQTRKAYTLCIPKKETDKLLDLSEEEYSGLMNFSRKVGLRLRKVVDCERIVIGNWLGSTARPCST